MPVPRHAEEFLALVEKSGVVDAALLEQFHAQFPHYRLPTVTARQLAEKMVREGVLTVLQASQLLRGKWRNFVLSNKYKLLEYLGTGGMGQVFLCQHLLMGNRVALKILPPERASDPVCLQRFYREARAVAAVNHPNIVRAYDFDNDDRLNFLVMEFVDGLSLQQIVAKFGPLSVARACHYIAQAGLGLQHAHEAGLVHRDIKPGNLLLDRSGLIKILDLGLARFFYDSSDQITLHNAARKLIGTVDFLAPEQVERSHDVDIRADIYSLGVTFYFLLTGRSPYEGRTLTEKLLSHRDELPHPIRDLRPDVPEGVAAIIERMLAKDPRDRFQTPIEVAEHLEPWTLEPIAPPSRRELPRLSRAARSPKLNKPAADEGHPPAAALSSRPAVIPTSKHRLVKPITFMLVSALIVMLGWAGISVYHTLASDRSQADLPNSAANP